MPAVNWKQRFSAAARRLFGQRSVLGIELSPDTIRVVEICRDRGEVGSVRVCSAAMPQPLAPDGSIDDVDAIANSLRQLLERGSLRVRAATVAVPASACVLRRLSIPSCGRRELERRVQVEIDKLELDGDCDWSIDWSLLRPGGGATQQHALLVAVPTDVVRSYAACLREADLLPVAIEVDVVALERLVPFLGSTPTKVAAIVDVGATSCSLLVARDGAAAFHGSIALGPGSASVVRGDSPSVDPGVIDLADAIHQAIGFFWRGDGEDAIDEVWLCGEGALQPGLLRQVEMRMRAPTQILPPLGLLAPPHGGVREGFGQGPEWALALALALREGE